MSKSDRILAELKAKRLARAVKPAPTPPPRDPTRLILGRDAKGVPVRLSLFTRASAEGDQPAQVVVDPQIAFGRPVLAGRGVPTAVLADRFKAGDTLEQLADDYEIATQVIEEALRCELERKAA